MLIKNIYRALFFLSLSFAQIIAFQEEKITLWESDITIHVDGKISVIEKITVNVTGEQIKHGIFRDFPTQYKDKLGNNYNVCFSINKISVNNNPTPFQIKKHLNGKRICIGDQNKYVSRGINTFLISYTTDRQLGYFKDHDELYWNVTGCGWVFPIQKVIFTLNLPTKINAKSDKIYFTAYTGYQGEAGEDFTGSLIEPRTVKFETTRTLYPKQGLTIAVAWPKGFITQPSYLTNIFYFLKDNIEIILLTLILIFFLLFYIFFYIKKCSTGEFPTIIPLFEPPKNFSAGAVYCIKNFGYDPLALTAEIVDMARAGYLTISYENATYVLDKNTDENNKIMPTVNPELHKAICNILFKEKNSIILNSKSSKTLNNVNTYLETYLEDNFLCKYTDNFYEELSNGIIFGIILAIFPATILLWKNNFLPVIIFSILFVIMCFIFFLLFKIYTPEGKKIISQINGFKMFLETTEIERINIIGTPPEKTPELYEKYLPYAIALGIEAEWTKQFAPLFNQMQQNEIYYRPIWITHPNNYKFHSLSSGLTSNLSNAISSAINPPGSHSGFGGGSSYGRGGSSGGGGGGGGGGGW